MSGEQWGTLFSFSVFFQSCLILCDPMDYSRPGLPESPINNKGQFLFFTFMALLDITNQIALLIK